MTNLWERIEFVGRITNGGGHMLPTKEEGYLEESDKSKE